MHTRMPLEVESSTQLPDIVQGYVSVRSKGGKPLFQAGLEDITSGSAPYHGSRADIDAACKSLDSLGLAVLAISRIGVAVAGKPAAFEALTGGKLVTFERLMHAETDRLRYVTHVDVIGKKQPETRCLGAIKSTKSTELEGVLIERPRMLQAVFPAPIPPIVPKFHLRVPNDVALGLNAIPAHRAGRIGEGVTVAMVDSGQATHPFFVSHRYNVQPAITVVPGTDPGKDPVGHGTGESANIFACAPGAVLRPIRASNNAGALVGAIAGFIKAKEGVPAIMTNSWGGDGRFPPPPGGPDQSDIAWSMEIIDAIEQGIFVVFSAGNGSFSIEPQVPAVLAAGGTFMTRDLELRASNYTSGYQSPWFAGVTVPDVTGLVGLLPRAQYLMLPIPPGCEIDVGASQPAADDPTTDGTAPNDGWALFSGTSAAAPQIAGAAAVILGAKPGLTPAQVTEALKQTAVDITTGTCHPRFNFPAQAGLDLATGLGLVDVAAAVDYALANFP